MRKHPAFPLLLHLNFLIIIVLRRKNHLIVLRRYVYATGIAKYLGIHTYPRATSKFVTMRHYSRSLSLPYLSSFFLFFLLPSSSPSSSLFSYHPSSFSLPSFPSSVHSSLSPTNKKAKIQKKLIID